MNYPAVNQMVMTIFPELAYPPRVMGVFPYFSDIQVKTRVIQLVSGVFEMELDENFTEAKLYRFLRDNRTNIRNMVEDIMEEDDGYEPEEAVDTDQALGEFIMDIFDDHIDIHRWVREQASP